MARRRREPPAVREAQSIKRRCVVLKRISVMLAVLLLLAALPDRAGAQTYTLRWADEFDGAAGSAPDQAKWGYDIGGNGWGNNELETYTSRTQNAFLDGDGHLIIKLIKETLTGPDGIRRDYTSARLLTRGKFTQRYGRIEARVRVPFGPG